MDRKGISMAARALATSAAPAFLGVLLSAGAVPQERPGTAGVPFPKTPPAYRQPVTRSVAILQGNDGPGGHDGDYTRYAWDYRLSIGSPVVAARSGVVAEVHDESLVGGNDRDRYLRRANTLVIDHLDGTGAVYAHLQGGSARVRRGEYVVQGEWIANSGDTGYLQAPHLHFMVIDLRTRKSVPAAFTDFRGHGGVPEQGDKVPPAKKPDPPQEVLDEYHRRWRAAVHAENLGCPGLAWTFARETALDRKYPGYYYRRVLAAQEASLRERLVARLNALAEKGARNASEVIEAFRLLETLEGEARGFALRKALARLKGAVLEASELEGGGWKNQRTAIRAWAAGLRAECTEDRAAAAKQYARAITRGRGPFREKAEKSLYRLAMEARSTLDATFAFLEDQWSVAAPSQRGRIVDRASRVYREALPVLEAWLRCDAGKEDGGTAAFLARANERLAAFKAR